ncbi:CDP-diacylglycerol--serine O-phosphatidyltransferase [Trichinella spiralis]|uniref:CDP-diacylglycerol--serine O-phosphatidyltransferase n=1 Tax=Trichinella spiralis TaxID=6334 RepID=A0ABR3KYE1_TRISP
MEENVAVYLFIYDQYPLVHNYHKDDSFLEEKLANNLEQDFVYIFISSISKWCILLMANQQYVAVLKFHFDRTTATLPARTMMTLEHCQLGHFGAAEILTPSGIHEALPIAVAICFVKICIRRCAVSNEHLCSASRLLSFEPTNAKHRIIVPFPLYENDCQTVKPHAVQSLFAVKWALEKWHSKPSNVKIALTVVGLCSDDREIIAETYKLLDKYGYYKREECLSPRDRQMLYMMIPEINFVNSSSLKIFSKLCHFR